MVNHIAAYTNLAGKVIHSEVLIMQVVKNNFREFVNKCLVHGDVVGHDNCFDPLKLINITL